jgi:hypothetical protein
METRAPEVDDVDEEDEVEGVDEGGARLPAPAPPAVFADATFALMFSL